MTGTNASEQVITDKVESLKAKFKTKAKDVAQEVLNNINVREYQKREIWMKINERLQTKRKKSNK